jgi:TonB family protein
MTAGQLPSQIYVRDIVVPDYPRIALRARTEGTISISFDIGADGKVLAAHAARADPLLMRAADENVRNWSFGFAGKPAQIPVRWTVLDVYKLVGSTVQPPCPTVPMYLPDRVEVTSVTPEMEPENQKSKAPS